MADYLTFWRTNTAVFRREVAHSDLFCSAAMRPKLERLLLQCRQPHGLLLLIGPSGTGKSTLLRWLYDTLEVAKYEVLLTSLVRDESTPGWLTPRLAEFMGVPLPTLPQGQDLTPAVRRTAASFDELIAEQRRLLVAIDAAHRLTTSEATAEISAYLNLQALAGSCVSFLLAGDLRLKQRLQEVPELQTRVAFTLELAAFTPQETAAYIDHRLRVAGVAATFTEEAISLLQAASSGIAAMLDNLAESCLMEAAFSDQRTISHPTAQQAIAQIFGHAVLSPLATIPEAGRQGEPAASLLLANQPPLAGPDLGAPAWLSEPKNTGQTAAKAAPTEGPVSAVAVDPGIKLTSLFKSEPGRNRS